MFAKGSILVFGDLLTFLYHHHQAKIPTCMLEVSKRNGQIGMNHFQFGPSVSFSSTPHSLFIKENWEFVTYLWEYDGNVISSAGIWS